LKEYKKLKRVLLLPVLLLAVTGCSSYVIVHWKNDREESKLITVRFHKTGFDDKVTAFWVNMRHSSKTNAVKEAQEVKVELKKK
jgi:hypothetical protein